MAGAYAIYAEVVKYAKEVVVRTHANKAIGSI